MKTARRGTSTIILAPIRAEGSEAQQIKIEVAPFAEPNERPVYIWEFDTSQFRPGVYRVIMDIAGQETIELPEYLWVLESERYFEMRKTEISEPFHRPVSMVHREEVRRYVSNVLRNFWVHWAAPDLQPSALRELPKFSFIGPRSPISLAHADWTIRYLLRELEYLSIYGLLDFDCRIAISEFLLSVQIAVQLRFEPAGQVLFVIRTIMQADSNASRISETETFRWNLQTEEDVRRIKMIGEVRMPGEWLDAYNYKPKLPPLTTPPNVLGAY